MEELTYATQMKLRKVGKVDASRVVKDLTESPRRSKKYVMAMRKSIRTQDQPRQLSPLKALSMFTEAGLTKAQYERVRETNKSSFRVFRCCKKLRKNAIPKFIA